ncbi:hypothetical protein [Campylobacter sp. US33a]|uniref:Uncharacterized protein n=1 Tax=Campylobacter sp. CCS1377 TaxID=3158229 RepID=A0AAU7E429_9BACT|nr:hypothetical protein [Campylobacter sp. US33a]MCW1360645.1 hypothetical protein [Campylobacter jejuni]TEY03424.1 hypothetical protein ELQ16_02395 [Campylobacter sp. US33a]
MIYILEFFKGASWALVLFGAFFLFFHFTYFYLYLCTIGLLLSLVVSLLLRNYELHQKLLD